MLNKLALLELSALTPDLGALNERSLSLPLAACEAEQLQVLNTHWVQIFTQAMNKHRCVLQIWTPLFFVRFFSDGSVRHLWCFVREMYGLQLCDQTFQQKCQTWMVLLEKLETGLPNDVFGNDSSIREQLSVHQVRRLSILPQDTSCLISCYNVRMQ